MRPPHDASYKELFSFPELIEDLLRGFVHEPWVEDLDFSTLEKTNTHYVTPDQQRRSADMVWRLRTRKAREGDVDVGDDEIFIYLLMEFQSTSPRHMALRVLTYLVLFYEDLRRQQHLDESGFLPPVLPIVLYSGLSPWSAPQEMAQLVRPWQGLEPYSPSLRYLLLDERRLAPAAERLGRNLSGAVFRLEAIETPQDVQAVVEELLQWLPGEDFEELRRVFTAWIVNVILAVRLPETELPQVSELKELQRTMSSQVVPWSEMFTQRGIEQGLQQGEQRGRRQGESALLQRLLTRKFQAAVSPQILQRLDTAEEDQLLKWAERVITAETLEEVFADD